ncbi:MAG: Ig domain-containing protein [Pirellulaceae bacterium]|nr:Ig domain-containing protein [Pirellulaceae bacterium]
MNSRERMLAIAVGACGLLLGGYFLQSFVAGQFTDRRHRIESLEGDLRKLKTEALRGKQAVARLGEYEARSLPPQPEVARSLFQSWLLEEVGQVELIDPQVRAVSTINEEDVFIKQSFTITGKGNLQQLVELLHAIYRHDYLQRISLVSFKPIKESKLIDATITIEGVSMLSAAPATQLTPRASQRLALPTRDDYLKVILGRNLFGPPNNPPKLASIGKQRVYTGRPADFQAKGTDPDPLDRVQYALTKSADPAARFDAYSGQFRWTPKSPGEYQFVVQASDDGYPSKSASETVTISVTEPPPPEPVRPTEPPPPPKLAFDDAKYTVLTAVLDISGQGEVWLLIRPKGQTLKLHAGDKFEIGSIKGVVAAIGESDFTFASGGKQRRLAKGDILEQAKEIAQSGELE